VPLSVLVAAQLYPEQNRGNAAPALGPRSNWQCLWGSKKPRVAKLQR